MSQYPESGPVVAAETQPDYHVILHLAAECAYKPLDSDRDADNNQHYQTLDAETRDAARALLRNQFASWMDARTPENEPDESPENDRDE